MKKIYLLTLAFVLIFIGCNKTKSVEQSGELTPEEAREIAKEAYIFGYPLVMGYKSQYFTSVLEQSPAYRSPFNVVSNDSKPADDTRKDVVSMNADTPYTTLGIDLRTEPMVLSIPAIKDRYYVFQMIDLFTHNFAFIGTRLTGTEAGDYVFVGPNWEGDIPEGKFKQIYRVESDIVIGIGRTQLKNKDDITNVIDIQKQYKLTGLSEFLGTDKPVQAPALNWIPITNAEDLANANFIKYMNFYLNLVQPINAEDADELARFAKIGIAPGKEFDGSKLDPKILEAINLGVQDGIAAIKEKSANIGELKNGWSMMDPFGNREFFKGDRLLRAAAVMVGIYGNDKAEAFYPVAYVDDKGETLNAKTNKYQIKFTKDQIPPAKYFWSMTMYDKSEDGVGGYLIKNPINRFLINSTTEGLKYDADGGFTIYIQNEKPQGDKVANWLPAPAEEFYLMMRIYGPEESALNGSWAPPAITKVN